MAEKCNMRSWRTEQQRRRGGGGYPPMGTTQRGGVIGPHTHGNVGRQVADDQDNTRRGGAIGPRAHGNAARHVVDGLNMEGNGQPKS